MAVWCSGTRLVVYLDRVTALCTFRHGEIKRRVGEADARGIGYSPGLVGSVIKKRRKKMRKHKHKKMLKKTRWARRAHA